MNNKNFIGKDLLKKLTIRNLTNISYEKFITDYSEIFIGQDAKINYTTEEMSVLRQITGIQDHIAEADYDYLITLTFRRQIKDKFQARNYVNKFLNLLNKQTFGRSRNNRINAAPVAEKTHEGAYHIHILLEDPTNRLLEEKRETYNLKEIVRSCWQKIPMSGFFLSHDRTDNEWFKPIYDKNGAIAYVTKTMWFLTGDERDILIIDLVTTNGTREKSHRSHKPKFK